MLSVIYAECHLLSVTDMPFMLRVNMLNVFMLSVTHRYALYAESQYAECIHAECHYVECRGALSRHPSDNKKLMLL
jgi:hypothetical protein